MVAGAIDRVLRGGRGARPVDFRVLITGSRRMTDWEPIREGFDRLVRAEAHVIEKRARIVVVHGAGPGDRESGAPGCDELVQKLFDTDYFGVTVEPHPPVETKFGRWPGAGPRRNSYMVGLGADWCLAFPCRHSKGTVDCLTKAWKAGIPTISTLLRIP